MASIGKGNPHISRRPVSFLLCSLLVVTLAAGLAATYGCGGGGSDKKAESVIKKFLEVGQNPGTTSEVFLDKLPPGLPDGLPEYPGSKLVGSTMTTGGGTEVLGVLREAGDPVDKVYMFYEQAVDTSPWQIALSTSPSNVAALQFTSTNDPNMAGALVIQPSGDNGGDSVIYLSVQMVSPEAGTTEPFKLEPSKPLPHDWPAQVPIYPNATITDTGWGRSQGSIEWQISFLAVTTAKDIIDFYRTELTSTGWSVTDEAPQGEASVLSIENIQATETWSGGISAQTFAQDPTYAQATIQLRIGPSATPQPSGTQTP